MSESHDAQLATSYFAQDVQAVGVRGAYTGTAEPAFIPSIETSAPAAAGPIRAARPARPDAVVRLAWDDYTAAPAASRAQKRVAYVVEGSELHRITCDGSGAVIADLTIAHDLVAPFAAVSCANAAGAADELHRPDPPGDRVPRPSPSRTRTAAAAAPTRSP